jgi:hypothetical protein
MINPKACTCANTDRKNREHTCPYKVAMYGRPAKCTCCEYCTRVCKKDVY